MNRICSSLRVAVRGEAKASGHLLGLIDDLHEAVPAPRVFGEPQRPMASLAWVGPGGERRAPAVGFVDGHGELRHHDNLNGRKLAASIAPKMKIVLTRSPQVTEPPKARDHPPAFRCHNHNVNIDATTCGTA
jgi:hypothetical protein